VARLRCDVAPRLPAAARGAAGSGRDRALAALERRCGGIGEERHALLEPCGARVLGAELAAEIATVDRLAEDRRLPERECLEPAERLAAWRESGATSLLVSTQQPEALQALAEIAL
jgi:hypothetical protein